MGWILDEEDLVFEPAEYNNLSQEYVIKFIQEKALEQYKEREEEYGSEIMREVERMVLLKNVDTQWMDHIDAMEELKRGIRLRAYGQRDPIVEYRLEGFDMFDAMIENIRDDTVKILLSFKVKKEEPIKREQVAKPTATSYDGTDVSNKTVVNKDKVGRNDLCPCGSGKKYKKCCGK